MKQWIRRLWQAVCVNVLRREDGHMLRRDDGHMLRRVMEFEVEGSQKKGRLKGQAG